MALTMYIILRKDLIKLAGWTAGSVTAQACHGATKALWIYQSHPSVIQYMKEIDRMHKVCLEVKNESQLRALIDKLKEANIELVEWTEKPEDILTCMYIYDKGIVTRPYEPEEIKPFLKKCSLYK